MKPDYHDIIAKAGEPLWWDSNGVPRYITFHPHHCGIYNKIAILTNIACQQCQRLFLAVIQDQEHVEILLYRDPPQHPCESNPNPCPGSSMNSEIVNVLEWWKTNRQHQWERQHDLEAGFSKRVRPIYYLLPNGQTVSAFF
jgi:hypothetical protein